MTCEQFQQLCDTVNIEAMTFAQRQALVQHHDDCPYCQEFIAEARDEPTDPSRIPMIHSLAEADRRRMPKRPER